MQIKLGSIIKITILYFQLLFINRFERGIHWYLRMLENKVLYSLQIFAYNSIPRINIVPEILIFIETVTWRDFKDMFCFEDKKQ